MTVPAFYGKHKITVNGVSNELKLKSREGEPTAGFVMDSSYLMQPVCGCNFVKDHIAGLQKIQSFSVIFKILKIEHPAIVDVFDILNIWRKM